MIPQTPIRDALADPLLLGHVIADDSWAVWRTLLIAAMGEPLTDAERTIFTKFTGREREPLQRVNELAVVAGRRGGKTRAMGVLATYIATLCDHSDALSRGETGVLLCIAQDQRIATKILDFVQADIEGSDILRGLFKARRSDTIELSSNINIEVRPASFRKLRGPTYIGVIADELAFWYTDSGYANPDIEILAAVRPGLLTTRGPLIMASSPYLSIAPAVAATMPSPWRFRIKKATASSSIACARSGRRSNRAMSSRNSRRCSGPTASTKLSEIVGPVAFLRKRFNDAAFNTSPRRR
jgi:hypothetical protein